MEKLKVFYSIHKRKLGVALLILLLIGMTTGILLKINEEPSSNSNDTVVEENNNDKDETANNESEEKDEEEEKEEIPVCESDFDEYSSSATYVGGDKITYNGKNYEAKWWTSGEEPGKSDVWKEIDGDVTCTPIEDVKNPTIVDKPEPGSDDLKVVGYYPSWEPSKLDRLQYDVLTHVNYSFAIPTNEGTLLPLENPEIAEKIIDTAHKSNVKVLIAVGGWSYNDIPLENTFIAATNSDAKIEKFANEIVAMVDKYGFDGVDMDWEHPRTDGSTVQYEKFMLTLSKKLKAIGKLLTSAVVSGVTPQGTILWDAKGHSDKVLEAVDWINVMAYDGGDGALHSSYDFAVKCNEYWINERGLNKNKVVLGVPFYGRPSWATYDALLKADPDAYNKDIVNYNGIEAHYNGIPTITKKSEYAKNHAGGIMIWEVSQDTTNEAKSLLSAIGKVIN